MNLEDLLTDLDLDLLALTEAQEQILQADTTRLKTLPSAVVAAEYLLFKRRVFLAWNQQQVHDAEARRGGEWTISP
jgi:hypothetical protein